MSSRTNVFTSTFDSYTDANKPTKNYGNMNAMIMGAASPKYAWLHFPLQLPTGATVISAQLTVYLYLAWTGSNTITVHRVTSSWKESTITGANLPSSTGSHTATLVVTGGAQYDPAIINVTQMMQDVVGGTFYGYRIGVDTSADRGIYASEKPNPALRPTLTVTWTLPPDAPSNLRPAADSAVSTATPVLAWDSDTPSQVRVIVSTHSDLSSPALDTGYVAQTENQYDLNGHLSLTDNTRYYWAVYIKDENSVASAVSSTASFYYRSLGTLAITVPSGSTVTTATPVFTHTFTGRTQSWVEYTLKENGVVVYDRPRSADSQMSFTMPGGYIRDTTATYIMEIRVWDTLDRIDLGAAKAYQTATKTFTITAGAGTTITALTATAAAGHIALAWTKAADADSFTISMDGVVIDDAVLGTARTYNVYSATPQATHTFDVQGENSGILTAKAHQATLAYYPVGMWLTDPESGNEVRILGQDPVSTPIGESSSVYTPIGRRDPVRITDSIRGYEGTVTGLIAATTEAVEGQTVTAGRDAMFYVKAHPENTYRLMYGYRNFPVQVGQTTISLVPAGEEAYEVQFEFTQDAEWDVVLDA